jgi:hypothetical protein
MLPNGLGIPLMIAYQFRDGRPRQRVDGGNKDSRRPCEGEHFSPLPFHDLRYDVFSGTEAIES